MVLTRMAGRKHQLKPRKREHGMTHTSTLAELLIKLKSQFVLYFVFLLNAVSITGKRTNICMLENNV